MNPKQQEMFEYMRAVLEQEDAYFLEAWALVEPFVMEALEDEE